MTIPSLQEAQTAFDQKRFEEAETIYNEILDIDISSYNSDVRSKTEKIIDLKEAAILNLSKIYFAQENKTKLLHLITKSLVIMRGSFAKSKTAKIIKSLLDTVEKTYKWSNETKDSSLDLSIEVTKDCISWSIEEKRTFLKQSLQIRLSLLYYSKLNFKESLKIIDPLISEFKKLDDKTSLVDVQLLESKNYFKLKNK